MWNESPTSRSCGSCSYWMFILRMPSPPIYCDLTTLGTYSEAVVLHLTFNTISRGILICRRTPPPHHPPSSSGITLQCLWEWWMQIPVPFNMDIGLFHSQRRRASAWKPLVYRSMRSQHLKHWYQEEGGEEEEIQDKKNSIRQIVK